MNTLVKNLLIFIFVVFLLLNFAQCTSESNAKSPEQPTAHSQQKLDGHPHDHNKPIMSDITIQPDSTILTTHLMGQFDPLKDSDFVEIDPKYADRAGQYLHQAAYAAFIDMHEAAQKDGIELTIKSATRNFARQKTIWESKWHGRRMLSSNEHAAKAYPDPVRRALKILEYSSMPGTSRHHWGTDIDLNAFVNSYFEKGKGLKEYEWLTQNAARFGYCQPYTPKDSKRPDGYNEEKWHWSYLPLAKKLSDQYRIRLTDGDIKGFDGAETAKEIGVVEKYVLGINQSCL